MAGLLATVNSLIELDLCLAKTLKLVVKVITVDSTSDNLDLLSYICTVTMYKHTY